MFAGPKLDSPSDIWSFLKNKGGLKLDSYDKSLPGELVAALYPSFAGSNETDLESLLRNYPPPVEEFLVAFFEVVQPFADMMVDLLQFVEKARANQGKANLQVKFDFDRDLPPLSFDLNHFRRWQETWQSVFGIFRINVWNNDLLWRLNNLTRFRSMDAVVHDDQLRRWLADYYQGPSGGGDWSPTEPPAPKSGVDYLDPLLARAWRVWERVVSESKYYGSERGGLRAGDDRGDNEQNDREEVRCQRWPRRLLASLDREDWAGSLARGLYSKAEYIRGLDEALRHVEAGPLSQHLSELFDSLQSREIEGEGVRRVLEDFLNLPVWQQRHEVYSAWIATQIANAVEDKGVVIHSVDGQLLFEFKGTHLATIGQMSSVLYLMAEVRSPLLQPLGFGRKKAMQPDYSLFGSPITSPKASILALDRRANQVRRTDQNICLKSFHNGFSTQGGC
jgi:hypothetical protein